MRGSLLSGMGCLLLQEGGVPPFREGRGCESRETPSPSFQRRKGERELEGKRRDQAFLSEKGGGEREKGGIVQNKRPRPSSHHGGWPWSYYENWPGQAHLPTPSPAVRSPSAPARMSPRCQHAVTCFDICCDISQPFLFCKPVRMPCCPISQCLSSAHRFEFGLTAMSPDTECKNLIPHELPTQTHDTEPRDT